jgi:hypothetical protein
MLDRKRSLHCVLWPLELVYSESIIRCARELGVAVDTGKKGQVRSAE